MTCDAIDIRRAETLIPTRWKNGAGQTRELCVFPPHSDLEQFIWRASIADVDADGPFSCFPGIDRTIMLLEGAGFTMELGEHGRHRLCTAFEPFPFPGEAVVTTALEGGATRDFNLMVRRSHASGQLEVWRGVGEYRVPADAALLYVARGAVDLICDDAEPQRLTTGDSVRLAGGAATPRLSGGQADAMVIVVRIQLLGND